MKPKVTYQQSSDKVTKILYIGRHEEIRATILRLINAKEDWIGIGARSDSDAIDLFARHEFDVVLLGCGLEPDIEDRLSTLFRRESPDVAVVKHYGGGSGLLTNEILSALAEAQIKNPLP